MKLYKPYNGYKESEVRWIGKIPRHWKIGKIKHIATFVNEKSTPETDDIKISPENVESKTGKVLDFYSSYDSAGVKFQAGDILFNKLRVYLSKVVFAEYDGYSLGEMIVIRPSLQDTGKYLFYLMLSCRFIEYCNSISDGVKMPRTDIDDILNARIPITSRQEQAQIASFLDRKTAEIDRFIANKERLITLLNEQKTSVINRVVTKGINPGVKLKFSGVEWLGKIPEHWEVRRLKFAAEIILGQSPHESTYNTKGIGAILVNGPAEYSESDFGLTRELKWTTDPKKWAPENSLLFCLRGSTTGRLNVAHRPISIGRGVAAIKAHGNQHFLNYSMIGLRAYALGTSRGSTFPSVTGDILGNYPTAFPPLSEQHAIVAHINRETEKINTTVAKTQKEIDFIKEYRQALISEAVTGKIDVRETT